jgi:hypothetical protein
MAQHEHADPFGVWEVNLGMIGTRTDVRCPATAPLQQGLVRFLMSKRPLADLMALQDKEEAKGKQVGMIQGSKWMDAFDSKRWKGRLLLIKIEGW